MPRIDRFVAAGWLTYAAYYVGRVALAAAKPSLAAIGHSYATLGWFDLGFLWTYAGGQLISGRLADRVPARMLMAAGLIGSALLSAAFSVAGIGTAGLVIWMLHGLMQSLGWSPLVRAARCRMTAQNMGLAMCFIATAYQAGSAAGHALGGVMVPLWSWRGPFLLPLILYPSVLALCYKWLSTSDHHANDSGPAKVAFRMPRAFWLLGAVLVPINILRYGVLLWLPPLLTGAAGVSIRSSGLLSAVVIGAGITGTLGTGFLIRGRTPAEVVAFTTCLLITVSVMCCTLTTGHTAILLVPTLMLTAACLHAAHAIVVAVVPAALAPAGRTGTAAGTIDAIGYIGTGAAGVLTGYLARAGSWNLILLQWAGVAALGSVLAGCAALMLRPWRPLAPSAAVIPARA